MRERAEEPAAARDARHAPSAQPGHVLEHPGDGAAEELLERGGREPLGGDEIGRDGEDGARRDLRRGRAGGALGREVRGRPGERGLRGDDDRRQRALEPGGDLVRERVRDRRRGAIESPPDEDEPLGGGEHGPSPALGLGATPRARLRDAHAARRERGSLRRRPRLWRRTRIAAQEPPPDDLARTRRDRARLRRDGGPPRLARRAAAVEPRPRGDVVELLELDGRDERVRRLLREEAREGAGDVRGALEERIGVVPGVRATLRPARHVLADPDRRGAGDAGRGVEGGAAEPGLDPLAQPASGVAVRARIARALGPSPFRRPRRGVLHRAVPRRAPDPRLLDERVEQEPSRHRGDRRHREHEELGRAVGIARREGEREPEREHLQGGPPAGALGRAERRESVAREGGLERGPVGPGEHDERRVRERARPEVGRGELARLERRVRLEDEDGAVVRERRCGGGGGRRREDALEAAEVRRRRMGPRLVGRERLDGGAADRERGDQAADDRLERGVRRGDLERERFGKGRRALDLREEGGVDVGEAGRERREPGRLEPLGGGEIREAGGADERSAVPPGRAEAIAEREEERRHADRILRPRRGEGAPPVVEPREPRGVSGDALRVRRRLAADAVEPAEPLRERERSRALPPRARLALPDQVAPGRAAVGGGDEDAEHWTPPRSPAPGGEEGASYSRGRTGPRSPPLRIRALRRRSRRASLADGGTAHARARDRRARLRRDLGDRRGDVEAARDGAVGEVPPDRREERNSPTVKVSPAPAEVHRIGDAPSPAAHGRALT